MVVLTILATLGFQNILTFTPPGFNQQLNVKFPDSRLAVCAKCKKNFKTRDMCRVRNTHSTPPWTTAYICITIDDSCLDEHGHFVDKPMTVRMVQWQPYCVTKPFDPKTPVCAACKRTNRTRSFCRERHKHRQLPWCSVYVLLSTLDAADPSTVVAGASQKVKDEPTNGEAAAESAEGGDAKVAAAGEDEAAVGSETIASDPDDRGDDINEIAESRTFLAKVSCRSTSIHWLEMAEYDTSETAPFAGATSLEAGYPMGVVGMPPHLLDPNHASMSSFYQSNMNHAAQQHQNELKSRQQYFFQMHQHPYPPPPHGSPGMQPGPWQQAMPYPIGPPGGEVNPSGVTAGEAAAAKQRDTAGQHPPPQPPLQPHWASMYYPPHGGMMYTNPPPPLDGPAPQTNLPPPGGPDDFHAPQEAAIDDGGVDEKPDEKRQRIE
jgi:hypothetical protein